MSQVVERGRCKRDGEMKALTLKLLLLFVMAQTYDMYAESLVMRWMTPDPPPTFRSFPLSEGLDSLESPPIYLPPYAIRGTGSEDGPSMGGYYFGKPDLMKRFLRMREVKQRLREWA